MIEKKKNETKTKNTNKPNRTDGTDYTSTKKSTEESHGVDRDSRITSCLEPYDQRTGGGMERPDGGGRFGIGMVVLVAEELLGGRCSGLAGGGVRRVALTKRECGRIERWTGLRITDRDVTLFGRSRLFDLDLV